MREAAPQAAEAAQVGDAEHELEGDVRMVEEEVRLLGAQGLHVVDEGAVVSLREPEPPGLTASRAWAGLRDGIVQFARARVRDVPDPPRARVEEVALNPRGEVRAHGARDGARDVPQAQRASAERASDERAVDERFSSFVLFTKPFHGKKSTRYRDHMQ